MPQSFQGGVGGWSEVAVVNQTWALPSVGVHLEALQV